MITPDHVLAHLFQLPASSWDLDEDSEHYVHAQAYLRWLCANISRVAVCYRDPLRISPSMFASAVLFHARKTLLVEMGFPEADSLAWNPELERLTACPRKLVESFGDLFERIIPEPHDPVWVWADMGEMLAREAEALSV